MNVITRSTREKYTQRKAYLPDCDHGSCCISAISCGVVDAVMGTMIRFTSDSHVVGGCAISLNSSDRWDHKTRLYRIANEPSPTHCDGTDSLNLI